MKSYGVAVVGTGFIGPVHVEALRRLGQDVRGILGSTAEKSQAAAKTLGLPRAYTTYTELLADPSVQVVHLASPNIHHFDQCRRALSANKHVVCEKPLAMTSQQTAELVQLAEANPHLITAVNYNIRFYPCCLEARQRVHSGQLGEVFHVTGAYLQDWLLFPNDYNWRVQADLGGELRAIADIGTHWLDLILFITGLEIQAVCADLRTVHPTRHKPLGSSETFTGSRSHDRPTEPVAITTEDYGSVLLRFRNGARGCLTVSQVCAGRKNSLRFDIACAQASLAWESEEPNLLFVGQRDKANQCLTRDPALLDPIVRPFANYPGGHAEGFPDSFKQLYRAIYEAIERVEASYPIPESERLYPNFRDGHREALLCDAILKSQREQRWVSLENS